ncbi:hypothetical protein FC83_GL000114 [Agrilactobacillus composti DSM 18527 = JCM 14202]|uniref:Uncharacterized protein n=1 Tax=Agrilactobacillus composti DSM 18527 = JCM 14202 TaxID=1423734 RepID=X0PII5_9LACO|nr:hypothetical protein [Agrilactobacillus composti]KRM32920.1 hypothetical protein FC83_GL000114 [Agrilactobacillus composti DSM 18527 = JCM 14202]GAF41918.1 hypothetical protein JCM14202_3889 [Agrilactobacillus composti DSM 18527 = JCM 14202]
MKTIETLDMEHTLYYYCRALNQVVVEEVKLPDDLGIVDTLSQDSEQAYTCFELKVTKNDFHSKAKLSFVGHYNYFVFPSHLLDQVLAEVPDNIGILVFDYYAPELRQTRRLPVPGTLTIYKKAPKQTLGLDETQLAQHFLRSLNREVDKAKRLTNGLKNYNTQQLLTELSKRRDQGRLDTLAHNSYQRFLADSLDQAQSAQAEEIAALKAENIKLLQQVWALKTHQPLQLPGGN